MASYAILLALSGFRFDAVKGETGFNPSRAINGEFRCFWSTGTGWGRFSMQPDEVKITVHYGTLKIKKLDLPFLIDRKIRKITVEDKTVKYKMFGDKIEFDDTLTVRRGNTLRILLDPN